MALFRENLISLDEARQRLDLSPSKKDKPMDIGPLSPPEPPADPPGYTLLYGDYSHIRPSERPLGRPAPTDLSFGPGYYPGPVVPFAEVIAPLPWWVYWQFLWIAISVILAIGMIFHALP